MKASFFDKYEEVGAVVFRSLYPRLELEPVVVWGVQPDSEAHVKILEGFIWVASEEKKPFDLIIKEPRLPALRLPPGVEVRELGLNLNDSSELVSILGAGQKAKRRILIYTANVLATHLIKGNPVWRLESLTKQNLFSVASADFALRREDEGRLLPKCVGEMVDESGGAPLGCKALQMSRVNYRKKIETKRIVGLMNQEAAKDYLLTVSLPSL